MFTCDTQVRLTGKAAKSPQFYGFIHPESTQQHQKSPKPLFTGSCAASLQVQLFPGRGESVIGSSPEI